MPHKLQIRHAFEQLFSEDFKRWLERMHYLTPYDVVRGIECVVTLHIKNIGNKDFPSGLLKSTVIRYSGGIQHELIPSEIPEIRVNEEETTLRVPVIPMSSGPGVIEIELSAKDGEPIECYQRRLDRPVGINRWLDIFYVVDRESLNIMWRLDMLRGRK